MRSYESGVIRESMRLVALADFHSCKCFTPTYVIFFCLFAHTSLRPPSEITVFAPSAKPCS